MPKTLGYHLVKSAYGLWLPGDERGSWSEAWDEELGYIEPHTLHPGDPVRLRMAQERMKHPKVRWSPEIIAAMVDSIEECAAESDWKIVAAAVENTHLHLQLTYSGMDIDRTAKWLAQRMTKSVHANTTHTGPVFCKGRWCVFLFDESHWYNTVRYIEAHNIRRGLGPRPYAFIAQ